jgi:hypothetical protein
VHIHTQRNYIYLFYADIEAYCETHPYIVEVAAAEEPKTPRLTVVKARTIVIDMTSYTPAKPPNKSLNILPYVILALTFPYIRFNFKTEHNGQHALLCSFARDIVFRNVSSWKRLVLDSRYVKEIRIHWKEKCVEIVVKPDSEWVRTLEYGANRDEYGDAVELKADLGLRDMKVNGWRGRVVVASVEDT